MPTSITSVPTPVNEPVTSYAPGTPERARLEAELARQAATVVEIPCVVGGRRIFTGNVREVRMPCDHGHVLARQHLAGPAEVAEAVAAAEAARGPWAALTWESRAAVMLRAAELLSGPWRERINAATMLGQAKTAHQADIDAACELIDFWRFNVAYYREMLAEQPRAHSPGVWNRTDLRPLDGFVFAIAPFNFTSIAANLCTAPALMGNTTLWKPSIPSALACWLLFELLEAAGLPPGVVNLLGGEGPDIGPLILARPELGGVHFTGSTAVFQSIWREIGGNIQRYRAYPRIVGETGGKDFIVAHPSAEVESLAVAIVRGGFEYQGQKCSAASRIYVPRSLWPAVSKRCREMTLEMKQGDVRDFSNFVGAVIDERAWKRHAQWLERLRAETDVLVGGHASDRVGWYVEPTWQFTALPWRPRLYFRYASFSGDDTRTPQYEEYRGLFFTIFKRDWDTWYMGEIAGEFHLFNQNQKTHMAKLKVFPTATTAIGLWYYSHALDTPQYFGLPVRETDWSDEINLGVEYYPDDRLYLFAGTSASRPGPAARQVYGDDETQWVIETFVSYTFR